MIILFANFVFLGNERKNTSFGEPRTFTEKLQWLKIYDYKPEYTQLVDKLAVKDMWRRV